MTEPALDDVVVFHHHLFKNAGTSFDALLRENFGDAWTSREFERGDASDVIDWIRNSPGKVVFSSHTAPIVPIEVPGRVVLQCVLIRHPIDRIKSAYAFESKQDVDTHGAVYARTHTFGEYVDHRMDLPNDFQCRNFHVRRLAGYSPAGPRCASELERAMATLERISFVGIVEEFEESMRRFRDLLAPHRPDFALVAARANVSRPHATSLPAKIREIREELGETVYERLIGANLDDLRLYAFARRKFVEATLSCGS